MRLALAAGLLVACQIACQTSEPPRTLASRTPSKPSAPSSPTSVVPAPTGDVLGEYMATWDPTSGMLSIEARLAMAETSDFGIGAPAYVRNPEVAGETGAFTKMDASLRATPCATGPCRIRYQYRLRSAGKGMDDIDNAVEENALLMAPPSTWLLVPKGLPERRIRFKVIVPEGESFVTGVFHAGASKDTYEITLDDLETAPYSAFGAMRVRTMQYGKGSLDVAIGAGKLALSDESLMGWTQNSVNAIEAYFGRFPMIHAALLLVPGGGRFIGEGRTLAGGGGSIFIRVGDTATESALKSDWVMVHEMVHLSFPSLPFGHQWVEEGVATYVEPFARVRAGTMPEEEAWRGLLEGLPKGQPEAGDRGLDKTHTWGRTYWGGALFWFVADVEIHKRTNNAKGLQDALRGILEAGGNDAVRWSVEDTFAAGDKATGTNVLTELYAKQANQPVKVDLASIESWLGASVVSGRTKIDDKAPGAATRRSIATGKP